jgi:hypothetical protein
MVSLVWLFILMTPQGPVPGQVHDETKFTTVTECKAWGERMAPRATDFARGAVGVPWAFEIQTSFQCKEDGDPA